MLAVTMPQRSLVWPFHWSPLMADKILIPLAMDTELTSGSSVDNENTTLSQLLDEFQEDEETSMAPLNGICDTEKLISVPFLNGSMEMNNDILDLSKPLQIEGLQHGISSMSLDSLNNDTFVDALEVQSEVDDPCLSGMSELNSCPDGDVETEKDELKGKDQQILKKMDSPNHDGRNIDNESETKRQLPLETVGSDSTTVSALSRSPESYTTLYKAFEIAQEESIGTDHCDKPKESTLDILNRTSPKLQRVAVRKAKINPGNPPIAIDNPVVIDQKQVVRTPQKLSHLQDSSLNLTWKNTGDGQTVTTFADILQKKGTPSPKSEKAMNIAKSNGIHWTELMQEKSDSETDCIVRRIRKTKRIPRPKSLPIQLRHIRRPASRPLKTPENKQSKAYIDFLQSHGNMNVTGEDEKSLAVISSHQSAPTPVAMDTHTSPSCSPPSLSSLPFYLKRPICCNNTSLTMDLHLREAPDGLSESPNNKLNLLTSKKEEDKIIIINDNVDINANLSPKNHLVKDERSDIFSSDSESEEEVSDTSEDTASPIDFETDISKNIKCNGQSEGLLLNSDYDWVSLESVLNPSFSLDNQNQKEIKATPQPVQEVHQATYDSNGNSLSKLMHDKSEDIRLPVNDNADKKFYQQSEDHTNFWLNQTYNGNSDKKDTHLANNHWNKFDYVDAEETFLPLEPLPDYAESESIQPSHITTRCFSDTLSSPSELDADAVFCDDNESFYLSLPPSHDNSIISSCYSKEHSKTLNSNGGTETSSTSLSSSLSSLAELHACKHTGASDSRSNIPLLKKGDGARNPTVANETQTDYICYRPMRKLSEARFLKHNLQDPAKDNRHLKQFIPGKLIAPAQKSSVISHPESAVKPAQNRNPRLIYKLLEQLKEQAAELELKRLKRNSKFPVSRQATNIRAALKGKEATSTHELNHHTGKSRGNTSQECSQLLENTIQYINHRPLKPIHVVDADYRWRKAQKDIHSRRNSRGYYEPMYMTDGYHTLPAMLNWYKNHQNIYTDQSCTSFKRQSPIRNQMTDLKSDVSHRNGKGQRKRDATKSMAIEDAGSEHGFDDWQDLEGPEGPPQDITVSPRDKKQSSKLYELDMVVMKGLVTAVGSAVDLILDHFSRASKGKPQEKAVLGDTVRTPTIGFLVLNHLCPAIANIIKDGMKPYIRNFIIGRMKNSIWQVVEATTELGPGTRSLYELVCLIQEQKSLSTDALKFNAFIFGLLSVSTLLHGSFRRNNHVGIMVTSLIDMALYVFKNRGGSTTVLRHDTTRYHSVSIGDTKCVQADAIFSTDKPLIPISNAVLGDTVRTPTIGFLVLDHLCPAIANIIKDGMKPYIRNFIIGRMKNSIWQVVEATTELGPGTRSLYELVCLIQEQKSLSTDALKFNAFIFGLLSVSTLLHGSTKCLEVWLNHIRRHPDIVKSYFDQNAFLSQCNRKTSQLFNDLLVAVQPLSLLPFKLALDFELKYTHKETYLTRAESLMNEPQSLMSLPWLGRSSMGSLPQRSTGPRSLPQRSTGPRSLPQKDEGQGASWQSWANPSSLIGSLKSRKEQSLGIGVESKKGETQHKNSDSSWMRSKELLKTAIVGRDNAIIKERNRKSYLNSANSATHRWRENKTEGGQTRDKTFQTQRRSAKHNSISNTVIEGNQRTEQVRSQIGSSKSWSLDWMTEAVSKKLYGVESRKGDTKYPVIGAVKSNSTQLQKTSQSEGLYERDYPSVSVMDNIGSNVIKAFDYMLLPKAPKEIQMVEMKRSRPMQDETPRTQITPPVDESRTAPSSDKARIQTAPQSASKTQQNSVKTRCHNVSMEQGFLSFSKGEILEINQQIDKELLLCSKGTETGLVYEAHVEIIKQDH
ncbi:uncharacterized protein LOC117115180 [Anneissia japonica]|uniref:uncharacterized protein LOC117115180 n=1 Tax=Anneissia japonica TaxID=1529436 RepID=UPI0014255588|nr:uncharacterized protein LOC117115180 [Anneissia japonica]